MVIFLLVLLLGAGLAAWRGQTHDSRDPDYGLNGLVGATPPPAVDEAGLATPSETVVENLAPLVVPAAWLPQVVVTP